MAGSGETENPKIIIEETGATGDYVTITRVVADGDNVSKEFPIQSSAGKKAREISHEIFKFINNIE